MKIEFVRVLCDSCGSSFQRILHRNKCALGECARCGGVLHVPGDSVQDTDIPKVG